MTTKLENIQSRLAEFKLRFSQDDICYLIGSVNKYVHKALGVWTYACLIGLALTLITVLIGNMMSDEFVFVAILTILIPIGFGSFYVFFGTFVLLTFFSALYWIYDLAVWRNIKETVIKLAMAVGAQTTLYTIAIYYLDAIV